MRRAQCDQLFAMKIMKKVYLTRADRVERTRTERWVLQMIDHPLIMKVLCKVIERWRVA